MNFKVSDAWGDLDGNAQASATVVAPTELAMSYLSKKVKLMKRPRVAAIVREKLTKLNPSFCAIDIARQDAKYQIAPRITITSWAGDAMKSVLTDPGSILKGILQDRLDKKRAPDEGAEQGSEEKSEKEKRREEKKRKKREREDAIRGILEGLLK